MRISNAAGVRSQSASIARLLLGRWVRYLAVFGVIIGGTLPFVFSNATPEGDLYYVGYSISRSVETGTMPAHMSPMYELAPLYYQFYIRLFGSLSVEPGSVLWFLNHSDWLFGLGLAVVLGLVLREIEATDYAPLFILMLFLVPVYWYVSLYAHPITLSVLFFLLSLLLFLRYLAAQRVSSRAALWFSSTCFYLAALLFRPDAAFLFLFFPLTLWSRERRSRWDALGTTALLAVAAAAYVVSIGLLPGFHPRQSLIFGAATPSVQVLWDYLTSFFARVRTASDYALWTESLELSLHAIGWGSIVVAAASVAVLVRKRRGRHAVPPLAAAVCVGAAWLGHPIHVRRYYQLSILIVLLAYSALVAIESERRRRAFAGACAAALLLGNLALPLGAREALSWEGTHRSGYAELMRSLSYDGAFPLRDLQGEGPAVLERAYAERALEADAVVLFGTWSDVGATSYFLQSSHRVKGDRSCGLGDEALFACNVLELSDGTTAVLMERHLGDLDGLDSLDYLLAHRREYFGSAMVLLERECGDDLAALGALFDLLHVEAACREVERGVVGARRDLVSPEGAGRSRPTRPGSAASRQPPGAVKSSPAPLEDLYFSMRTSTERGWSS